MVWTMLRPLDLRLIFFGFIPFSEVATSLFIRYSFWELSSNPFLVFPNLENILKSNCWVTCFADHSCSLSKLQASTELRIHLPRCTAYIFRAQVNLFTIFSGINLWCLLTNRVALSFTDHYSLSLSLSSWIGCSNIFWKNIEPHIFYGCCLLARGRHNVKSDFI